MWWVRIEPRNAVVIKCGGVDPFALREIGGKFLESLAELALSATGIVTSVVVERNREMNQRLEKHSALALLECPDLFPRFMRFKVAAAIEEVDAMYERGHSVR